jgi:hypothetical protein
MVRVLVIAGLFAAPFAAAVVLAQPEVRERAVEEVMPGIFVRGGAAVVMDVEPQRCSPPCSGGRTCRQVCEETPCPPDQDPLARCSTCGWSCAPRQTGDR